LVELNLKGIGFKAFLLNKNLYLELGFSHYIQVKVPNNIDIKVKKQRIIVSDFEFAKFIQLIRVPDAYKAQGIQFKNVIYKTKQGKKR
jgi:large subunit ribosomal protein L6